MLLLLLGCFVVVFPKLDFLSLPNNVNFSVVPLILISSGVELLKKPNKNLRLHLKIILKLHIIISFFFFLPVAPKLGLLCKGICSFILV